MSHATLIVTKTHSVSVDDQMAPFNEELEVPRYVEYTKQQLIEKERAEIAHYEKTFYSEYLKDPEAYAKDSNTGHLKYISEEFPAKLTWTDEQIYQDAIKWETKEDVDQEGNLWSERNPNAKWDWYETGGRWLGFFKLKLSATGDGKLGNPGAFGNNADFDADIARVKDIDWDAMRAINLASAEEDWAKYEVLVAKGKTDEAERMWGGEKEVTKDMFLKRNGSVYTFAVLHDGHWYERSEGGWAGDANNMKDLDKWIDKFDELIASLDPDDEITLVDYHI